MALGRVRSSPPYCWERTCCDSAAVSDSTSRSVPCHEKVSKHTTRDHGTHVSTVHNHGTTLCESTQSAQVEHSVTHCASCTHHTVCP